MRFAVDTGGTFTDLLVEDASGALGMFKAPTTPADPIQGVIDALEAAAAAMRRKLPDLLAAGETFIYGTTHAINAIITGRTARTAFLTSEGHPDVLVLREGGRMEPFNFTVPYPQPYVPRALTWEIPGRLRPDGSEFAPFDAAACRQVIELLRAQSVQAVAVCLLWSIVNPAHELRLGELLAEHLPGVPFTLSHRLNPALREYRRASSACIDASLKPMMQSYMARLDQRLRDAGFAGRVLVVTSQGGVMDAADVAAAPIHLVNSGPSMAPVSGRHFAQVDAGSDTAVIADTGGTTYDVSLVRRGRIPFTRETWIGQPFRGHMTGFPSVDVRSIGAGGGSIAWIDDGGMLHVGPDSAGAAPGPACYGQGGARPTLTDAALVLGYLDPAYFLGGAMPIDPAAAREAIARGVAAPLGLGLDEAAAAVLAVATETMVQAILDITVNQGIDPRSAVLVGGGGAAGLNSVWIARRLETARLLIPEVGAALSAAGALMSDLTAQFRTTRFARSAAFDHAGVNAVLDELERQAGVFIDGPGRGALSHSVRLLAEARYPEQVWELEVALPCRRFAGPADVAALVEAFHQAHEDVFAIRDAGSAIEIVGWSAAVSCRIRADGGATVRGSGAAVLAGSRSVCFPGHGRIEAAVRGFESIAPGERLPGPAIVESSFTTVVLPPGAVAERRASGSLAIAPGTD